MINSGDKNADVTLIYKEIDNSGDLMNELFFEMDKDQKVLSL